MREGMAAAIGMTACRHRKKRKMTHRKVKRGGPAGRQAGTIRRGENMWNLEDSQVGRQAGRPEGWSAGRQAIGMTACRQRNRDI